MEIAVKFGQSTKRLRLKRKMSQGDVAKKLGVSPSYVSKIERGIQNMSLKKIEQLAKALDVAIEDLIK